MNLAKKLLTISSILIVCGCGVKGDPLPPEKPVDLGRGRPTYRKATEGIKIEKRSYRFEEDEEDQEEDRNDE